MTIFVRSLYMLLTSICIFNMQAMHTSSAQVKEWADKNQTALVAGSIVTVGGVTAYYFSSPKIFGASVVGAGVYVACRSLCNDDEFQEKLKALQEQRAIVGAGFDGVDSGIVTLTANAKDITQSAVQLSEAAQRAKSEVANKLDEVTQLDISFLQKARKLPFEGQEIRDWNLGNIATCHGISKKTEETKEGLDNFDAALDRSAWANQKAAKELFDSMDKKAARIVTVINEGVVNKSKLVDEASSYSTKLLNSTEATQIAIANNVAMCNNINQNTESFKKGAGNLEITLQQFGQAGQVAEKELSQLMDARTARTVKLINEGTEDILKLLSESTVAKRKLSDSY